MARKRSSQAVAWKLADRRNAKAAPKPKSRWENKASGQKVYIRSTSGHAPNGMIVYFALVPQGSYGFMGLHEFLHLYQKSK